MTYIVSGGALNSTHSLTLEQLHCHKTFSRQDIACQRTKMAEISIHEIHSLRVTNFSKVNITVVEIFTELL